MASTFSRLTAALFFPRFLSSPRFLFIFISLLLRLFLSSVVSTLLGLDVRDALELDALELDALEPDGLVLDGLFPLFSVLSRALRSSGGPGGRGLREP